MKPTPEQIDAVTKFQSGEALKINAFAGTGKTTTLKLLADSTERRGMYLAFNKAIAADAKGKFPANTTCSTIHSLAFRATPQAFRRGDKMTGSINANAVAKYLSYEDIIIEGVRFTPRLQGYLTLETLRKFVQGGRNSVDKKHVPDIGKLQSMSEEARGKLQTSSVEDAARLWQRMCDPQDPIPLGHDGYLKLWAMSRPILAADFVLLDEAQDTNPVVLEMLKHQKAQIVYVGDRHQQIYEWRGAVNAMERISTPHEAYLTTSFRFGERIASAASRILERLGETRPLTGNAAISSFLKSDAYDAIICRTNASVISAVLKELAKGGQPHVVGGTSELIRMLRGVQDLKRNEPSDVAEFFGFANWGEVVEHSNLPEGQSLKTFVKLVETHGESLLIQKLNETAQDEAGADVVISTAHKAKGREWDTVSLTDDFLPPQKGDDPDAPPIIEPAEIRLFYVALTRAKIAVDVSPAALLQFEVECGPKYEDPRPARPARATQPSTAPSDLLPAGSSKLTQRPLPADQINTPKKLTSSLWFWVGLLFLVGLAKILFF